MKNLLSFICILFISVLCYSQTVSDYLILSDIGPYRLSHPKKMIPGMAPIGGTRITNYAGEVGGAPFTDHTDTKYEVRYLGSDNHASPTVKVVQHTANESDKWIIHELEGRLGDEHKLGQTAKNAVAMNIMNNRVFFIGTSNLHYMWLSSNKVIVEIDYYDPDTTKPEPFEVIQAYLAKFPSIIPSSYKLIMRVTRRKARRCVPAG